jgi:hypothetical protein
MKRIVREAAEMRGLLWPAPAEGRGTRTGSDGGNPDWR